MDIPQLKLLAGRVRDLLQHLNNPVGHSQALDLVAAIPGLRSWPEVQAFPARVAASELDSAAAGRLAFRLKKKFGVEFSAQEILAAVLPAQKSPGDNVPQIWPSGPPPGVYVTTSQAAIDALLDRYEEATDGHLVYAERAGNHWAGSIDLGEDGLWSGGLSRVPSGTLIIVGPVKLNQQDWDDACSRLARAAMCASESGHRVALLMHTPSPSMLCEDVMLMVDLSQPEGSDHSRALMGVVTDSGELEARIPFAGKRPPLQAMKSVATGGAIPASVLPRLERAIGNRTSGLILLGSERSVDNPAVELVTATLAMTEHCGPAARIMARNRSTPAKDWLVPASISDLPFLPSIESAYDQGYRRMIVSPNYTDGELLLEFADQVMLIAGVYGSQVDEIFVRGVRMNGRSSEADLLPFVIAVVGVKDTLPQAVPTYAVSDVFIPSAGTPAAASTGGDQIYDYLTEHRMLRWEDEFTALIDAGKFTTELATELFGPSRKISEFLAARGVSIS